MTNQSISTFFIIVMIMSACLFFYQVEKLNSLETQSSVDLIQLNHSTQDFERYATKYHQSVNIKNGSDFMRGAIDFFLAPFSSVINMFLDNVTDIEKEANQTIQAASELIKQYQQTVWQSEKIQQKYIEHMITWRNIGLIMCLFSAISALYARTSQLLEPEVLLAVSTSPVSVKKAIITIIAGGVVSCIPSFNGLAFKLIIPSILIAYFIVHRQCQNKQIPWKKRTIITIAVSLLVSLINYGFYAWQEIATEFAISGLLLGLFIATSIQYIAVPLSNRQFFSIAAVFTVARLIAVFSAAYFGAELSVLEGILSVIGILLIVQTHADWVKQIKFDLLLSWLAVYSATTFIFGNYYQAELIELVISYFILSISSGMFLTYHLFQIHKKKQLFVGIEDKGNLSQITAQDK